MEISGENCKHFRLAEKHSMPSSSSYIHTRQVYRALLSRLLKPKSVGMGLFVDGFLTQCNKRLSKRTDLSFGEKFCKGNFISSAFKSQLHLTTIRARVHQRDQCDLSEASSIQVLAATHTQGEKALICTYIHCCVVRHLWATRRTRTTLQTSLRLRGGYNNKRSQS